MAAEIDTSTPLPRELTPFPLRKAHGLLEPEFWGIAGRAVQIITWNRDNIYCSRCGNNLKEQPDELLKSCPVCQRTCYPRLSPAVIMSVTKGDLILLGRSPRFPSGMYSTLAGFVEPGETLEDAVRREVHEEVGLTVSEVDYVSSQPWPFPNSLMIGFTARYEAGEILVNREELEDAAWFSAENMPLLPHSMSVARLLIDRFLERYQKD